MDGQARGTGLRNQEQPRQRPADRLPNPAEPRTGPEGPRTDRGLRLPQEEAYSRIRPRGGQGTVGARQAPRRAPHRPIRSRRHHPAQHAGTERQETGQGRATTRRDQDPGPSGWLGRLRQRRGRRPLQQRIHDRGRRHGSQSAGAHQTARRLHHEGQRQNPRDLHQPDRAWPPCLRGARLHAGQALPGRGRQGRPPAGYAEPLEQSQSQGLCH